MQLSESRQKALDKAQKTFFEASGNLLYQEWRKSAIQSFDFYDGFGQYHPEILEILNQRNQSPIVVNKVKAMVNQASGIEINTRGKIAFRRQSNREDEELLVKGMTHYAFALQEEQRFSFKGSLRCRDALICGLGWSRMYPYRKQILYSRVHPLNIIFDADDFTDQLENMRFLIHMSWLAPDEIKEAWPHVARQIDDIADDSFNNVGNFTPEFFNRTSPFLPSFSAGRSNGSRLLVNEVLQKERRKYYCGLDKGGYYFETFDEDYAEELADRKQDIEEQWGTQIMRTVFCNDILLEYAPIFPNLPSRTDFPCVPCVWNRRTSDGVPIGWIKEVEDLQRQLNFNKLREIMNGNSKTAVIDANAVAGMSAEEIKEQIREGIIFKTGPGEIDISPNIDISNAMVKASERIDYELQQVSGMYSDSMGDTTNAHSGIAIQRRQLGTSRNLAFGFDAFRNVKKREGKVLLDLMQGAGFENMLANVVMDNEEKQEFVMNVVRESDGKILNDIRTLPVDIYVEIVDDYESSFEEQRADLDALLANPQAPLLLQNPYLLKIRGYRNADKIAASMQQLNQQQAAQQMAIKSGGGMPPPPQSMNDVNPLQAGVM